MKIDKELKQDIEKIANFCSKIGLVFSPKQLGYF